MFDKNIWFNIINFADDITSLNILLSQKKLYTDYFIKLVMDKKYKSYEIKNVKNFEEVKNLYLHIVKYIYLLNKYYPYESGDPFFQYNLLKKYDQYLPDKELLVYIDQLAVLLIENKGCLEIIKFLLPKMYLYYQYWIIHTIIDNNKLETLKYVIKYVNSNYNISYYDYNINILYRSISHDNLNILKCLLENVNNTEIYIKEGISVANVLNRTDILNFLKNY